MSNRHGENYIPFLERGKGINVRTPEETKMRILNAEEVKGIIDQMVQ